MSIESWINRAHSMVNPMANRQARTEMINSLKAKRESLKAANSLSLHKEIVLVRQINSIGAFKQADATEEFDAFLRELGDACDQSDFLKGVFPSLSSFLKQNITVGQEITKELYQDWMLNELAKEGGYNHQDIEFLTSFIPEYTMDILDNYHVMLHLDEEDMGLVALQALCVRASTMNEAELAGLLKYMIIPYEQATPIDFIATHAKDRGALEKDLAQNQELNLRGKSAWEYLISWSDHVAPSFSSFDYASTPEYDPDTSDDARELDPKKPHLMGDFTPTEEHVDIIGNDDFI